MWIKLNLREEEQLECDMCGHLCVGCPMWFRKDRHHYEVLETICNACHKKELEDA